MSQKYEKLKTLLKELFQLDQPDLDFGFYRVMHARSAEVSQFLDKDLLPQVKAAFAQYQPADKAALEKELAKAIEQAQSLGADPETLPKVKELRTRLAADAVDLDALEAEVYDHLYSFFRRYYSEGDFLSKRVYKPGVYAIPYEGEEVKLHWANADQYYIKTSEYLRDYAFRLRPDDEKNPMRVHFRLVDAVEGKHGNVKEPAGKERRFKLAAEKFAAVEDLSAGQAGGEQGKELVIRFTYAPDPAKQKDLNAAAEAALLGLADASLADWLRLLSAKHVRADGTAAEATRLRVHLDRFTARNTFDYFIHKDLGGFLRRELDFYIKNEVMHLDDVENESAPRVEQYLSKIKVIRRIAGKIIAFLAQLEDFQKKLWLKKKFVVETSWCVRLGVIPEAFYPEIAANDAQRAEWERLGVQCSEFSAQSEKGITGSLFSQDHPLKTESLKTEHFLKTQPTLMIDTRHFDADFTARLLDALGHVDEQTDGVLVHSENFQALSLMERKCEGHVHCVYIDPPYNTGDSEIPYKNTYLHGSWLTLMQNRLALVPKLLAEDHSLFIAIDDFEMVNLAQLVDSELVSMRREMIIVNHHPQGGKARTLAHTHEYMLACVPTSSDRTFVGRAVDEGIERRPFKRSGTAESNFRFGRPNSFYAILVDSQSNVVVGLEPPPAGSEYPTGPTADGLRRIYPIGADGVERVWRRSYESCKNLVKSGKLECSESGTIYQLIEANERTAALFSNWVDPRYNAGTYGANLLRDIIGEQNPFSYPKSVHTVGDAIFALDAEEDIHVLDYFAGSGTTGHAVINLNREDGGQRKFILVEQGDYFDTVLLPRLKKVTYSPEWKDGKPKRLATPEEAERSPRIMKVVRLESYEDTLNNLELRRTKEQQGLLDLAQAQGADKLKEQYMLRYLLDVETRGSQSLLNVAAFTDPTAYRLKVKRPGSDESRDVNVDLLETFNWLIGLTVRYIAAPQTFTAETERDGEGRLRLKGRLKQDAGGRWWFRTVTGTTPDGRKTLVIWRKRPGGEAAEGVEQDNLILDEWFTKQGYSSKDSECDLIYVNGDNNLENLKAPDDTWKVRLIEEDFFRLMFETEGV
jgi:adenine-specific DNA-methyltransferase